MLISRFWYALTALIIGGLVFLLFVATSVHSRATGKLMSEALASDNQVVSWYLRNDARERSGQLIKFALDAKVQAGLRDASNADTLSRDSRDKLLSALKAVNEKVDPAFQFDAVFAVDQEGRVVAHLGYEQARGDTGFELGGYPVVADALRGYVRDDTLVLDRMYRVVARPVETQAGQEPAGAIVGARIVDDRFALELSRRTGAAVAFFVNGSRIASGAPENFDKSQLDRIVSDLPVASQDKDYLEKGTSEVRLLKGGLGLIYSRVPGEAWQLGAGYAVGRQSPELGGPWDFFAIADQKDKTNGNVVLVAVLVVLLAGAGIAFSIVEHTVPIQRFRKDVARLIKKENDQLQPSRHRGIFRKLAAEVNDGMEAVVAQGGGNRRVADLQEVLGDLPAEPQMSAFALPGSNARATGGGPVSGPGPMGPASKPRAMPAPPVGPGGARPPVPVRPQPPAGPGMVAPAAPVAEAIDPKLAAWQQVYQDFIALKAQCGEATDGLTYEKFEQTLTKNEASLIGRHGATSVVFSVYVKDGKAALKASPSRS